MSVIVGDKVPRNNNINEVDFVQDVHRYQDMRKSDVRIASTDRYRS